jgi:hypothetical protein
MIKQNSDKYMKKKRFNYRESEFDFLNNRNIQN